jgi:hypothetical protein
VFVKEGRVEGRGRRESYCVPVLEIVEVLRKHYTTELATHVILPYYESVINVALVLRP